MEGVPISSCTSSFSGFIGPFAPHPSVTRVFSSVSKEEIEEIALVYRILDVFKGYPCNESQTTDGMVTKRRCVVVYVE